MPFDGRSRSIELPPYTFAQRLVVRFSMNVMPTLARLLMSNRLNTLAWRLPRCRVGQGSVIRLGTAINAPFKVCIGRHCSIHGHLKSRGGITIGDGVELVEDVMVSTQSHATDSPDFESVYRPVTVHDHAWLGPRSMVLPGVELAAGTVVAAGAILTKSTEAWGVYAGVPARLVKRRVPMTVAAKP